MNKKLEITKEFLEAEYLIKKNSARNISKLLGCSYVTVQSRIKEFGIPRRKQYKDLIGVFFGKLKVVKFVGVDKKQQALWECECECGNSKIANTHHLTIGIVKSCGCLRKTGFGDITGSHFANIKKHAEIRKLIFEIEIEKIWNLFLTQNRKCALSGVDLVFDKIRGKTTASLDRIDSSKGYVEGNVQWVHKDVNRMKTNFPESEFKKWVVRIYETIKK